MALKKYIDTGLANARTAHEESVRVNESTFDSIAHAVVNQVIRNTIKDAFLNEASRKAARQVTPDLPSVLLGMSTQEEIGPVFLGQLRMI